MPDTLPSLVPRKTAPRLEDEVTQRWHVLSGLLGRLHVHLDNDETSLDSLNAIAYLLETLPLATDSFGIAMNRVRNARRYLTFREVGAARFELRLLWSSLKRALAE